MKIELNQGLEPLEIYFKDTGKTETIYFNPSDSDLPKRLMECQKIIEEKSKNLKPYEIDESGLPDADKALKYYDEVNKIVCDTLDYAFGNKVSNVIFKYCGAYSVVNGNFQILNFLNAITPVIKKAVEKNNKAANAKATQYLNKYRHK